MSARRPLLARSHVQRRLKAAGVTYDELLETTRHELACLPQARHLSLTEIGSLLVTQNLAPSAAHFGDVRMRPQAFPGTLNSVCHRKAKRLFFGVCLEQAGDESSARGGFDGMHRQCCGFDILAAEHAVGAASGVHEPATNKGEPVIGWNS